MTEFGPEAWHAFEPADGVINGYRVFVDRAKRYDAYVEARGKVLERS